MIAAVQSTPIDLLPDFDGIWRRLIRGSKSRPSLTCQQFAESYVVLPDGPKKGFRFKSEYQPWIGELWREIENGVWPEVFLTSPSQCGKTLVAFVIPLLWLAHERGENVIVGLPDGDMWANKWEVDVKPVALKSSQLRGLMPSSGVGSKGGKVRTDITLSNGVVVKMMTPAGHEARRSAFTSRYVLVTEGNRFTEKTIGDLRGRMGAFSRFDDAGNVTGNQTMIVEGTLLGPHDMPWSARQSDDPDAAPISTESEFHSPCLGCGEYSIFEREHLIGWQEARSEVEAAKLARWKCPRCGHEFHENERRQSVARCRLVHRGQAIDRSGRITGAAPAVTRLFVRVSGYVNMLGRNTPTLGAIEWEAAQIERDSAEWIDKEQTLHTKVWAIPWEPPQLDSIRIAAGDIRRQRQSRLPVGVAPHHTEFITTGVDVGLNRCWYKSIAFCSDHTAHVIKYGCVDSSIRTKKSEGDEHAYKAILATLAELFELLDAGFTRDTSGDRLQSKFVFVDSGYQPDPVFSACRERGFSAGFIPIIGRGKSSREGRRYSKPTRIGNTTIKAGEGWHLSRVPSRRYYQLMLDADDAKLSYQSGWKTAVGEPGSITLYHDTPQNHTTFSKHVASEVFTQVLDNGEIVDQWKKSGQNHLLDCGAYAWIAGRFGGFTIDATPELPKAAPRTRRRSNFALSGGRKW